MTYDHQATYSPQDDKIRLFLGYRIPRDEWDRLKDAGFTWTMKQASDLVALWTPEREDIALELCGEIGDEDQPREERSADRAERFSCYQEKRSDEAEALANRYEGASPVHGHQNAQRAERAAARHDRIAGRAVTQWSKAEYWTTRTSGVIRHALYLERADVRHRRIKGLEAELRKRERWCAERTGIFEAWKRVEVMTDPAAQTVAAMHLAGAGSFKDYQHPTNAARRPTSLWTLLDDRQAEADRITGAQAAALWLEGSHDPRGLPDRWTDHLRLRLAYERQMLAAQGGTSADEVEMEAGGWLGKLQVQKVTKDRAGRVSKVYVLVPDRYSQEPGAERLRAIRAEGLKPGTYRAPTAEERGAFAAAVKAERMKAPKEPPLINPTLADAQRLQDLLNARALAFHAKHWQGRGYKPEAVVCITQGRYSEVSKGAYAKAKTQGFSADGIGEHERGGTGPVVCRVRLGGTTYLYGPERVIVLTDQPQRSLPCLPALGEVTTPATPAAALPALAMVQVTAPTQETVFAEPAP